MLQKIILNYINKNGYKLSGTDTRQNYRYLLHLNLLLPVHLRQSNPCRIHNLQAVQALGSHHVLYIFKPCDQCLLQYNSATCLPFGYLWKV
jgi:hypothetical protein